MKTIRKKIIISGPSGSGKTTIIQEFLKKDSSFQFAKSYTTRQKREHEVCGEEYFFVTKEEFDKIDFFESECFLGNYYGTPKSYILENNNIIFNLDVRGALNFKKTMDATLIFVLPPSLFELKNRLIKRNENNINGRINAIKDELMFIYEFNHIIINHNLDESLEQFTNILNM